MYPTVGPDDVIAFRVSRVRQVFPIPTIGYSTRLPPRSTSVPGLHLVSSAHIVNGTLNVNETVELAESEAQRLLHGGRMPAAAPAVAAVPAPAGDAMPMPKPKPMASLSLDLDDRWSYLRTAGHPDDGASYLDIVVPRIVKTLADHGLRTTVFIVGRDAERPANHDLLAALAADHEVGNHSFDHDQRIHTWSAADIDADLPAPKPPSRQQSVAVRKASAARATRCRPLCSTCCSSGATSTTRRPSPRTSARWLARFTSARQPSTKNNARGAGRPLRHLRRRPALVEAIPVAAPRW